MRNIIPPCVWPSRTVACLLLLLLLGVTVQQLTVVAADYLPHVWHSFVRDLYSISVEQLSQRVVRRERGVNYS